MPRVKRGVKRRRRVKKILNFAEGFVLGRRAQYRRGREAVERAWRYAYRDRRRKKRIFRQLWVTRVGIAAQSLGVSYSVLMHALSEKKIILNRKMLSEIAIADPKGFELLLKDLLALGVSAA